MYDLYLPVAYARFSIDRVDSGQLTDDCLVVRLEINYSVQVSTWESKANELIDWDCGIDGKMVLEVGHHASLHLDGNNKFGSIDSRSVDFEKYQFWLNHRCWLNFDSNENCAACVLVDLAGIDIDCMTLNFDEL